MRAQVVLLAVFLGPVLGQVSFQDDTKKVCNLYIGFDESFWYREKGNITRVSKQTK